MILALSQLYEPRTGAKSGIYIMRFGRHSLEAAGVKAKGLVI